MSDLHDPGTRPAGRPLKYTLCITQRCNLACSYCYIARRPATMSLDTARRVVAFIFRHAPRDRTIDIGFFGGEPLLEFELMQHICDVIAEHPDYAPDRVQFSLTTNGTVLTERMIEFLNAWGVSVCISCDGAPAIQNTFRRTVGGGGSAAFVERNIRAAVSGLPVVLVNAVYHPRTFRDLPATVEYLSLLGVRQIYLNPDYSAEWTHADANALLPTFRRVAEKYCAWYERGDPHFISVIDSKITVLLRGGYAPLERCQMGRGEMAFTPDGGIYPCERLIGTGADDTHRIGNVTGGLDLSRLSCHSRAGPSTNPECVTCSLRKLCMNWCGCANTFMTGFYNRSGPFLCASEKAAITVAVETLSALQAEFGSGFVHHLCGVPQANSSRRIPAPISLTCPDP